MNKRVLISIMVLTLIMVLAAGPAFAKKSKDSPYASKTVLLGGGLSANAFSGSNTMTPDQGDDYTTDVFGIGLDGLAGYFVISGLEIGGLLMVDYNTASDDAGETTNTSWSVGPQLGYFFGVSDGIALYAMLALGYQSMTVAYAPDAAGAKDTENNNSGFFGEPNVGAVFQLNKKIGLYTGLYLHYYSGSGTTDDGTNEADYDYSESRYGLKVGLFGFL